MRKLNILHITPHLGGGVGNTIVGFLHISRHHNEVLALGWTYFWRSVQMTKLGVIYDDHASINHIIRKIPLFDVVVLHYWNHPLMVNFLVRSKLPPCRLVIWGHNSGLYPPNVYTKKLLSYPDKIIFTSPLSLKFGSNRNIWSTGGVEEFLKLRHKQHKGFNVGYVGTIDYAKMHPNFVKMSSMINIPGIKFIVVGHSKLIRDKVSSKFVLPGYVNNLKDYYCNFDVFGYPLSRSHYGTCDLVLQIAMAAGVPPVVLDNPMEKTMVEHMRTGLVARSENEYVEYIKLLYEEPSLRERLSRSARNYAKENYSLEVMNNQWEDVFSELMTLPKTPKEWDTSKSWMSFADIFLESQGEHSKCFVDDDKEEISKLGLNPNWTSPTKGTVHNYYEYFPSDPKLRRWSRIMRGLSDE